MLIYQPFARPANQDKRHFELGASPAKPAAGYFAGVLGIDSEREILDAIAGLSNEAEIEDTLYKLFRKDRCMAHDFMKWRLGMKNAARP